MVDHEMYLFWERHMRGGTTFLDEHATANNKHIPSYNPDKPSNYLLYLDANNLYGHAMSQILPSGFRFSAGIALAASLLNFVIEPMGTRVLMERYALENASGPKDKEKIKALKGRFGAFHGFTSLLNLVVLIAIFSHGYWLSSRLVFV
jgi:hypothetical protein